MEQLLKSDKLNIEEIDLFKAVIRWGNHRRRDITVTTPLKEIVQNLIPLIRFPLISGPDLVNIVRPCNVVDDIPYLDALEFVNSPDLIPKNLRDFRYKPRNLEEDEEGGSGKKFGWVGYRTVNQFEITKKKDEFKKIGTSSWNDCYIFGDKSFKSGIQYWEITVKYTQSGSGVYVGITSNKDTSYYSSDISMGLSGSNYNCSGGNCYVVTGDRIGVRLDFKELKVNFYKNDINTNVWGTLIKGNLYTPVLHCYYNNDSFSLKFPKAPKI